VAIVAGIAARDVVRCFSGRRETVMARSAGSGDLRMVDRVHRREDVGIVTIFADVACRYVRRVLAGGIGAVMAAAAIATYVDMIEIRRRPAGRRMAVVAVVAAIDVCRRLAGCRYTVVTGTASADYLGVINGEYGRKYIGRVAIFADIAGLNMCDVLADCLGSVMAADAVAADIHMIEVGR